MGTRHLTLDKVVFYGRTMEEYRKVFNLTDADLKGRRVLDCPGGPDSFGAEARALGAEVVSCDPVYAQPIERIAARGRDDIEHTIKTIRATGSFKDADWEKQRRDKLAALDRFVTDFRAMEGKGAYVTAKLPSLPVADGWADLVLSAHLLFIYSPAGAGGLLPHDGLDLDFHRRAVQELLRVCRGELRLYPTATTDQVARRHPYAERIAHELSQEGYQVTFQPSSYFQGIHNFNDMMTIRRA